MGRQAFGTYMEYQETLLQVQMRDFQHLFRNNWIHKVPVPKSRFIHPQWKRVRGEHKIKIRDASLDRQPKTQWRIFKELWDRRTATAGFTWQIPYTNHVCLLENKIQECTRSQIAAEATHWIKEVEIIDPVGDLMFSSSVRVRMPDFEVLGTRIAAALNKIIHDPHFKRRVSLEEQREDRFFRGKQVADLIHEYFRVTGSQQFCRE